MTVSRNNHKFLLIYYCSLVHNLLLLKPAAPTANLANHAAPRNRRAATFFDISTRNQTLNHRLNLSFFAQANSTQASRAYRLASNALARKTRTLALNTQSGYPGRERRPG